jgi:hypothetical protein
MRTTNKLLGLSGGVVGLAMLAGCGGAARPAMAPEYGGGGGGTVSVSQAKTSSYDAPAQPSTASAPGYPSTGAGGASMEAPPAPPPATAWNDAQPAPTPTPSQRPGLGTEWGETRESHITEVSFLREDPSRPFAQAQLYYNDWQGVQALASFHGGPRFHSYGAAGGAITVSIRGAGGEALDAMNVGDRTYVIGQQGERYSIVIENHTPRSFEAVATVDGLDVMNGQTGSYDNRGYVLGPYANLTIDGFRQSEDAVAAFRFAKVKDSYAAQRGEARNVGVIGVAFFAQRGDDWSRSAADLRLRDTASPFPGEGRFAPPPWR